MAGINVLSCFDGISAGRLALQRAGIDVDIYYRSEIDKYANKVAMHHFPNDIQLGDVTKWREWNIDWSSIDLFIGGSPCQGFSFAGKQAGTKAVLNGEETLVTDREKYLEMKSQGAEFLSQSHLFWEFVLILDHIKLHNPNVKFLLENVKMKKELLEMIDSAMGVKSVVINSALVSAQNRVRHYWANWEITQPEDKGILLKDVLEDTNSSLTDGEMNYMNGIRDGKTRLEARSRNPDIHEKFTTVTANFYKGVPYGVIGVRKVCNANPSGSGMNGNVYHIDAKSPTLTTNKGEGIKITGGAIRGRYNEDGTTTQRLEVNETGRSNSLTTVQKDNVVVYRPCELTNNKPSENGLHHIANAMDINGHDAIKRVYSSEGKSPTVDTCTGGNREPKVLIYRPASIVGRRLNDRGVRDDYNKDVPITQCLQVKHRNEKMGCLTTVEKDCLISTEEPNRYPDAYNRTDLHYRKLTPTECARLQTFPDGWCESVVSNSQSYKAYGNSWTVDVIAHIFSCMDRDTLYNNI